MQIRRIALRRQLLLVLVVLLLLAIGLTAGLVLAARPRASDASVRDGLRMYAAAQSLNSLVLSSPSATATLQQWCADHKLAPNPVIVAKPVAGAEHAVTSEQRATLKIGPQERVVYRQVRLMCGRRLLSVAENWYVPSRLTQEMNRQLETTNVPFGAVVKSLNPNRTTLAADFVWHVLPSDWDRRSDTSLRRWLAEHRSEAVFREDRTLVVHEAVVNRPDALPISLVHENYKQGLLAFDAR
jgi:chorismate-pyruvate lyase